MKFLCDVHISYKIVNYFKSLGYEALHVNDILDKWKTRDDDICQYADTNGFIVVTKDSDFRDSYFVKRSPRKLLKINLGNISNTELIKQISECIDSIQKINSKGHFIIEVDKDFISVIDDEISNNSEFD